MAQKKESYFWTSYSDLMTSLFFVMLVLFVLVIVLLYKRMEQIDKQRLEITAKLDEIKKVQESTKDLSTDFFVYRPDYKKYVLNIQGRYPRGMSNIEDIISDDKGGLMKKIVDAGLEIQRFLKEHHENQYLLIIEGQASKDDPHKTNYEFNYELSYERALGLTRYWMVNADIEFGSNCEILISGSGDGKLDTHAMREIDDETKNQRFLIHIIPKNILETENE